MDVWTDATIEMERTADAASEYALRVFEGHQVAVDRVNEILSGLSDADIRASEQDLRNLIRGSLASLPLLATSYAIDRHGRALVSANTYPVPRELNLSDREFFKALAAEDAPPLHVSSVLLGRLNADLFFAVSRRRSGTGNGLPAGSFDGIVNVSGDPNRLAAGLAAFRRQADDTLALLRADGEILARVPGFDRPLPPFPRTSLFRTFTEAGTTHATYTAPSSVDGVTRLFAIRRVGTLPIWASANRSRAAIVDRWRNSVLLQGAIAGPVALSLFLLSLLALRAQQSLAKANLVLGRRVAERTASLAEREERLRLAIEAGRLSAWEFDLRTASGIREGPLAAELPVVPPSGFAFAAWLDEIHPDDRAEVEQRFWAMARGEVERFEAEFRVAAPAGGRPVWLSSFGAVVERDAVSGKPLRIAGVAQDITQRKLAEERQALLSREVDHRAKNALSVVLAALRMTRAPDQASYIKAIEGRVAALARAQTLLADDNWSGADLRILLQGELMSFVPEAATSGPTLTLDGPELNLPPGATQPLAMAFHELATNSVKYGALSVPTGQLAVAWTREGDSAHIRWVEHGGPAVERPPERKGFGTRVLQGTVEGQLGGQVILDWKPAGLFCKITLPLTRSSRVRVESRKLEDKLP